MNSLSPQTAAATVHDVPTRIVDAHVHLWSGDQISYPYSPQDNVPQPREAYPFERLHNAMRTAGVSQALAIQPRLLGYDHAYLLHATQRLAPNVRAVPLINPTRPSNVDEMTSLAGHPAVAGFRAIALDQDRASALLDPAANRLWEAVTRKGLAIGILTAPPQLPIIGTLAHRQPELTIVVDHLAGIAPADWSHHGPSLLALAAAPNVYVKLSALGHLSRTQFPYPDMHQAVSRVVAEFGASRTMWGSDWPHAYEYGEYHQSPQALLSALPNLSTREHAQIFSKTAQSAFGFSTADPVTIPATTHTADRRKACSPWKV